MPSKSPSSTGHGYSGTPLAKKLGIQENHRVGLIAAPSAFEEQLEGAPGSAFLSRRLKGKANIFVFFPKNAGDLARRLPALVERLESNGGLWIAWPKKSSGVPTDLDFRSVQQNGLSAGLVDNKSCAIDEVFSGLRFVYRLRDRPQNRRPSE